MTSDDHAIEVRNVDVSFNGNVAMRDLEFYVRRGERVAILGKTGAGKSTLLNLLVGNLAPSNGNVRVIGIDPFRNPKKLQGKLSMAFQSPSLLPWRTAIDNVKVGLEIVRPRCDRRNQIAQEWLERVHLGHASNLFPSQMSGGMRQRASIARAFAIEPEIVLLDESFSALDEVTARALRKDFIELCDDTKKTSIIVTHNVEEAFDLAHRVLVFGVPAALTGEFKSRECPASGDPEFAGFRNRIRGLMDGN